MGRVTSESRRVYIAGDGKEFIDHDEANRYEARRTVKELLALHAVGQGGAWYQDDFINFMLEHKDEILLALDPYYGER